MATYTEDHLIEQPAIQLMEHELGWDEETSNIERQTSKAEGKKGEQGGDACARGFDAAVDELTRDRSALSLVEANREIDKLLRGGVKVKIPDRDRGGQRTEVGALQLRPVIAPLNPRTIEESVDHRCLEEMMRNG